MDTQLKPAPPRTVSSPSPEPKREQGPVMGFLEHLDELRKRLTRAVLGLAFTTALSILFADRVLAYLITPAGENMRLQTLGPTEGVVIFFRVALLSGGVLAIPYITYQLWAFIAPGLTRAERRWVYLSIPATTLLFLVGLAFAWFILMPAALSFLRQFQSDIFEAGWTADQYVAFVTALLFWIGLSFEMPLIFFILARVGLVSPGALRRNWRVAVIGSAVLAALITPTIDPFNMTLVMGPLLVLYALSIILTMIAWRQGGFNNT